MRDHHFQMLSMKYFLKWRDRHWVNFEFFDKKPTTMPTFNFPTPYSIRMQPIDGTWCFPISDLPEPALLEGGRPIDGKPTGEWKQTSGAGWLMSGAAKADALSFLPSGAEKPARVICAPPPFTLLAAQPPSILVP